MSIKTLIEVRAVGKKPAPPIPPPPESGNQDEYDENDTTHLSANSTSSSSSSDRVVEPAIDYEDRPTLSSFNTTSASIKSTGNSLVMMMKTAAVTTTAQQVAAASASSPLTPRQIKQRNTAKRNSIPRSTSTSAAPAAHSALDDDLQFLMVCKQYNI